MKIITFSLQRDERVRAFIARHVQGKEFGRTEYGMLSLAASIDPALVRQTGKKDAADTDRYETWRRRGADPEQYRKLFPDCSSSNAAHRFDPDFGKELFNFIVQLLVDTTKPHLPTHH